MFNRKIRTRFPAYQEPAHGPQLRAQHDKSKATQKYYKDAKSNVKPHNILIGDKVLLLQKESKTQSRYDSIHAVTAIKGSQPQPYFNRSYPLDRYREDQSQFTWTGRPIVPAPLIAAQPTTPVAIQPVAQHTPRTVPLATELNPTQMAKHITAPLKAQGKCKGSSTTTLTGTWIQTLTSPYCRETGNDTHPVYTMPKLDDGNNRELTRTLYLN